MPRVSPRYTGPLFAWGEAPDAMLREEWAGGRSASQIACVMTRALGFPITKNMVIGRAHRLKLQRRAAPTALASVTAAARQWKSRAVAKAAPVEPPPVVPPRPHMPGSGCKFPLWGDGRPTHHYCDAPRDGHAAYCGEHRRMCMVDPARVATGIRNMAANIAAGKPMTYQLRQGRLSLDIRTNLEHEGKLA